MSSFSHRCSLFRSSLLGASSRGGIRLMLALGLLGFGAVKAVWAGVVTEFPLPTPASGLQNIVAGPDGNLWFTEEWGKIGRITVAGVITEFPIPSGARAFDIVADSDGSIWFTEYLASGGRIGRITTAGVVTESPLPAPNSPSGIAVGSDGNLWITEYYFDRIDRVTPSGVVTRFAVSEDSWPADIVAGPDGNLWYTADGKIGRITTSGVPTEFPLSSNVAPQQIAAGPDGNLWFTEYMRSYIGRITPDGVITEFVLPSSGSSGVGIAAGPDGNVWFTETPGNRIGRITPSGDIMEFTLPSGDSPTRLTKGPDGNLWFVEPSADNIGRLTPEDAGPCVADSTTLCLGGGRFQVRAQWELPSQGTGGQGRAVPLTDNTGSFWFFDPTSIEVIVKVLNACTIDGHYWVFGAGLTNVGVTLTVIDTQTGLGKTYSNRAGTAFQPIQDTGAFLACP